MARQTARKRAIAEAIAILTAPGGELDPFDDGVKLPEIKHQIVAGSVQMFVRDNPRLPSDGEKIAAEFLKFLEERQAARPELAPDHKPAPTMPRTPLRAH